MARPDIEVIFGAQIAGLVAGVKEAEEAIKSLRAPVDEFVEGLKGVSEALGIAFAYEKVKEWITEAAEAGEHAVNLGAALNLSAEAANNFAGTLSIVGANADTSIRLFGQLSRAIDEALTNKASRRAFAFAELRIDPEHLRDVLNGVNGIVNAADLLGDAYDDLKKRGGDTGVTGPMGVALGARQFAEIDKFISRGKDFRQALKEMWESTAPPSNEGLERLDELAEKFHLLEGATKNLGQAITDALSGPLGAFTDWATRTLASMTKIIQLAGSKPASDLDELFGPDNAPDNAISPSPSTPLPSKGREGYASLEDMHATAEERRKLADIAKTESGARPDRGLHYPAPGQSEEVNTLDDVFAAKVLKNSHAFGKYGFEPGTYKEISATTGRTDLSPQSQDVNALAEMRQKGLTPWPQMASRGEGATTGGGGGTKYEQFIKDKGAYEDLQKSIEQGGAREAAEVKQQIAQAKARGATIEEEKKLYADLDAAEQHMYAAEDAAAANFKSKWSAPDSGAPPGAVDEVLKKYKDHDAQKIQADTAFINESTRLTQQMFQQQEQGYSERASIDAQYYKKFEANLEEMVKKHQITKQEMYGFDIQYAAQQHDLERQALEDMIQNDEFTKQEKTKLYMQLLQLDAKYEAQVAQLREKATPKQDFSGFASGLAGSISSGIMGVAKGQESPGQALANIGEQILQKVMTNVIDKLIIQTITNLLQQLASDVANTGILAGLLTLLLAKPSIGGTSFSMGGIVPSAAGGWVVPSFASGGILAQVHTNEMVLPADISRGVQGAIRGGSFGGGGGGHTFNLNISAMDGASVMRHGPALVASINAAMRNGSQLRNS